MRTVVSLLLCITAASCAEGPKQESQPSHEQRRLESVMWDLKSHKLIWVVQKGTVEKGEFQVSSTDKYEISPDDAAMGYADERRGFSQDEAAALQKLLDTLSLYCAESVIWWDQGQGTKMNPKKEPPKGEKIVQPKREKKPPVRTGTTSVASVTTGDSTAVTDSEAARYIAAPTVPILNGAGQQAIQGIF